jgi:glycosyltransferase involved in cell wall biosynthesis
MSEQPLISLLLCTTGSREEELQRFLVGLEGQTCRDFEVILVDQSDGEDILRLVERFSDRFPVTHMRSARGLSLGRNAGLPHAKGAVVGFPDDDCQYFENVLEQVVERFEELTDFAGVCGRHVDAEGRDVLANFDHESGEISLKSVWRRSSSATIFLRSSVIEAVGAFDERLGVGSGTPWGSSEEIDYLCRALQKGYRLMYDPALRILHPRPPLDNSCAGRARARQYSRGMGFVLAKHKYPIWFSCYMAARPMIGAALDLLRGRFDSARLRAQVAYGRVAGYRAARASAVTSAGA